MPREQTELFWPVEGRDQRQEDSQPYSAVTKYWKQMLSTLTLEEQETASFTGVAGVKLYVTRIKSDEQIKQEKVEAAVARMQYLVEKGEAMPAAELAEMLKLFLD